MEFSMQPLFVSVRYIPPVRTVSRNATPLPDLAVIQNDTPAF